MILSAMLEADEDALVCDLAETYGMFDYESLPLQTVATLSAGLRGDSRIKMKMTGSDLTRTDLFLTVIADYLALIMWSKTKDGAKGRNRPKSIRELFSKKQENDIVGFNSPEEFEKARQAILNEVAHG